MKGGRQGPAVTPRPRPSLPPAPASCGSAPGPRGEPAASGATSQPRRDEAAGGGAQGSPGPSRPGGWEVWPRPQGAAEGEGVSGLRVRGAGGTVTRELRGGGGCPGRALAAGPADRLPGSPGRAGRGGRGGEAAGAGSRVPGRRGAARGAGAGGGRGAEGGGGGAHRCTAGRRRRSRTSRAGG